MDFIRVAHKENKDGTREFYPSLQAIESSDLVIRGGQFVAIWDEDAGLYSRRQSHVPDIIDRWFLRQVSERLRPGDTVKKMRVFDNQLYSRFLSLIRSVGDMGPELDQRIVFADETPIKAHAASFKMPYSLSGAACPTWNEIVGTLYSAEERQKIEWAIGSIFTGASAESVQKFYVFFGPPGSGKSTILNIIEQLFEGHTASFSAYDMGKADAQFSLEPFAKNPLVAIDQDGDLSRLELNKNLNSIVSHDRVLINSKGKNLYGIIPRSTLFIGTNEPIKISNKKSGLFRRLVDIQPTGNLFEETRYHHLMSQVQYELGAIAQHCINVFEDLGATYLSSYRSTDMMYRTNDIFNFVQDHRMVLEKGLTLKQAHKMYVEWCNETDTRNIYKQYQFRDLLSDYFEHFHEQHMVDGTRYRSFYEGLRPLEQFSWKGTVPKAEREWLILDKVESLLDEELAEMPAQYASESGTPKMGWMNVTTTLADLDTSKEHYLLVPEQHIVIDFDLKDEHGNKSLVKNLEAAALWPSTYVELSRSGEGLHLHYNFDGDVAKLSSVFGDGIEVKTLLGKASLRRRRQFNNGVPVATINSGIPLKEEKVLSQKVMSTEKGLRELILRALDKGINAGTKSNMDFIKKILDEAYDGGMAYDVTDMWDDIFQFAMGSTNQKSKCLEIAMGLKLKSEVELSEATVDDSEKPIVHYDCEVYPNFFAIGWIYDDVPEEQYVAMINPSAQEVQEFLDKTRRIGFNNRGYDAHICWAASLGYTNQQLYELSQRIITDNDRRSLFGAAYNSDYADLYDMLPSQAKSTLKKKQIEYGLPHKEMDLPWDQPVPDDRIDDVLEYLKNDVLSTREVAHRRDGDLKARQILAKLSGLEVINTNRQHTERLIFGGNRNVADDLVYTDLHEMFPGYKFDRFAPGKDKSTYKGESVGEGGLVRSKPGMYENVALLDVASMHPTSIIELNLFGKYTPEFKKLMDIRLALKKKDFEAAMAINPAIEPFITNPHEGYDLDGAKALSEALKTVINSVYGLTAASFPNLFRDPDNVDNIVAKRGSLFMIDLKEFVENEGFEVVHIKTDSVKIPNATPEIIQKVMEFGKKYGYDFEHEATFDKFVLVNDAVYVAHKPDEGWSATGAQFQHPVVFKTLFSKEEIKPEDYVEIKQVAKGHMYLLDEVTGYKQFIGRFGAFVPVIGGRILLRIDGEKEHSVTGTKGFLWELDYVAFDGNLDVDMTYFQELVDEALRTIEKYGSYAEFTRA
jgi:energy-coupling factor transporter ATP-binding protein EcfA2